MKFQLLLLLLTICGSSFGQWEQMNDAPLRRHHGLGFQLDGIGYVLSGGTDNLSISKTMHSYDPSKDLWTRMVDYPGPARGFSIGAEYEGKYYLGFGVGANNQYLNDLWVFDPRVESFTELPSCPCLGRAHPAFQILEGKIYAGTGNDNTGNKNDWWAYDIETQTWEKKANITGRRHHPYHFTLNNEIYVGSGHRSDWHKYDPATDSWTKIADLDTRVAGTQFAYGGKGYALSGTDTNHSYLDSGEFWEYDPELDMWEELRPHPGSSRWAPSSFIIDGYVYLFAGEAIVTSQETEVWRYKLDGTISSTIDPIRSEDLVVFPNPVSNIINLEVMNSDDLKSIQLINIAGVIVRQYNEYVKEMNVEELNAGLYVVKAIYENHTASTTIIKE